MRSRDYHLIPPAITFSSTLGGRRDVKFAGFFTILPLEVGIVEAYPLSSTWLYDDRGWDLGTAWKETAYDDSAFSGPSPARLGFGADGEVTTITDAGSAFTYYFRKDINIPRADEYHAFNLEFIFDDGLVCYINGNEVARRYITADPVLYDTAATVTVGDGETYTVTVPASSFVDGNNVIAVEVHQVNDVSTDLSFDMGLSAELYEDYRVSGPSVVNEGDESTVYTLQLTGADSGTYYYTVHPAGGFVETDGSFSVTGGIGTFTLSAAPDELVEGDLLYGISFRTDSITGTIVNSVSTTVNDVLSAPEEGTAEIFALSANGWLYEDSGSDLGTTWREVAYDDSSWSGPAQARLGFGLDGEVTTITDTDAITYYFRKDINIPSGDLYDEYDLEFIYDDGLICWVNNQEVARVGIGTGALFNTVATFTSTDGDVHTATIPASAFVDGNNVIAIELHQVNSTSSDVSLDMGLSARVNAPPTPVYSASGPATIDEGTSDTYTLSSSEQTGTYYYSIHPAGHFVETDGSFSLTSGTGDIVLSAAPDAVAEADTLVAIDFRTDSIAGTIVDTLSTTVNDVEPWIASGPSTINEGTTDTYFLSTTQEQGTYYYSVHPTGHFVEVDGSFTVNATGVGTFNLSAAPDVTVDGDILVAVDFRQTSVGGTIVDTVSTTVIDVVPIVEDWISFREGVASYADTTDTYVDDANPTTSYATDTTFTVDNTTAGGGSRQWGLLRFGELSGAFIDNTAVTVTSASLDLEVIAEGQGMDIFTSIIQWDDTDTYNSNTNVTVADTGYHSTSTIGVWAGNNNYTGPINIVLNAQAVQDWINDPTNNFGMVMRNTVNRDGSDFASSDNGTSTFRPRLQLAYEEPDI
jgi:hypothetical protein